MHVASREAPLGAAHRSRRSRAVRHVSVKVHIGGHTHEKGGRGKRKRKERGVWFSKGPLIAARKLEPLLAPCWCLKLMHA